MDSNGAINERVSADDSYNKSNTQGQVMQNIAHSIKGFMDDSEKGRKTNIDRELDENKYRKRNNGRSDGLSR